jgi:A/G-specific adenine glycosylase
LGYNRRAKSLWLLAKAIESDHKGKIPNTPKELEQLPGIGPYTARAVIAFAFNKPYACIETNIRSVYVHSFFSNEKTKIADGALLPLIERTLDKKNPREWYYALMDYGAHLKKQKLTTNDRHRSYRKQTRFVGSKRQVRGTVVRSLIETQMTLNQLKKKIKASPDLLETALHDLLKENIISKKGFTYSIYS